MRPTNLNFVIGCSGAGKSTFLSVMQTCGGSDVALVQVGKVLRAKYPPEYFEGSGAPAKTIDEAWQIMQDGIAKNLGVKHIFIDGQPRDEDQFGKILGYYQDLADYKINFIHVFTPIKTRMDRAYNGYKNGVLTSSEYSLREARNYATTADQFKLYEILSWIGILKLNLIHVDGQFSAPETIWREINEA